jgi:hypothetical protein
MAPMSLTCRVGAPVPAARAGPAQPPASQAAASAQNLARRGRGAGVAVALESLWCALLLGAAAALAWYVLALLLVAFVEQVVTLQALARAAWLSVHPAAFARLALALI